ncbi:hypothetical protein KIH41_17620 [Litoribacter ruber]|uniref:hypothetical protein n=1 Tax=Litoribacter ruber TaxID=702568 RepID=UPI001BD9EAA2|nr:hypothetical protein [Litoribacter ruber]MBT0813112.1 hypothetical protein [Litoribacter ruber]
MLESISAYFDHNSKRILEISKKYKYVAIISAVIAFYNLFNFFSPEGGATSILLLVFSSLVFWVSFIIRTIMKLAAKVADKISKVVKNSDKGLDFSNKSEVNLSPQVKDVLN